MASHVIIVIVKVYLFIIIILAHNTRLIFKAYRRILLLVPRITILVNAHIVILYHIRQMRRNVQHIIFVIIISSSIFD